MDGFVTRAEYEEHSKRMEDHHRGQDARIKKLEQLFEQNNKLIVAVEKIAVNVQNMQLELAEQGKKVEVLESKDGEMWRKAVGYVVSAVIGIAIGLLFKDS